MEAIIRFKDGTEITAEVNGDSYITEEKPAFPAKMEDVTVEKEGTTTEYEDAMLIECASADGRYWFGLMEKPLEVKQAEQIAWQEEQIQFLEGCIMEMSEEVYK